MFRDNKKMFWLAAAGIALLFAVTRLWMLADIPRGLHVDEAGMAYDAYCLANFGTDRYLKHFPVYLINYGDGQSAMYAYLAAICVKLMGFSVFAVRLPGVIVNGIAVLFGSLLVKEAYGRRAALTAAGLLTVCPYFIMASRFGLDCNLFLGFFTLSVYWLWKAVKVRRCRLFAAAGCFFGLTLYTYSLSWITLPVFLLFVLICLIRSRSIIWKQFWAFCIPLGLLASPLLLFLAVNMLGRGEISTPFFTIPKLFAYRGAEISLANLKNGLQMLKSILFFGPLEYNAFPEFGTLYYISVPLVIAGACLCGRSALRAVRDRKITIDTFVFIMFFSVLCCGLVTADARVVNKSNAVFFSLVFFIVLSLRWLYRRYRKSIAAAGICYLVFFVCFSGYYYFRYPADRYPQEYFNDTVMKVVAHVSEEYPDRTVYLDTGGVMQADIYLLLQNQTSPYVFMREAESGQPRNYDGYCTFFPEETDRSGVYIINTNEEMADKLVDNGFTEEEYCGYRLYTADGIR